MALVSDIYDLIDEIAPFDTAMDFDNVGILVGDRNQEVEKILVALDITNEVVNEAKFAGAQLIVSHHPVIFNGVKSIDANCVVYNMIQNGITAICAHTNLDSAANGVNKCLADALELKNLKPLSFYEAKGQKCVLGLIGALKAEMNSKDFAVLVKNALNCNGVRYTAAEGAIKTVAVCSGSGGDLINKAVELGADAYVTGEIKHHEILIANENNICVVDAGHFKSEDVVVEPLVNFIKTKFKGVQVIKSKTCTDHIKYI